MKQFVAVAAFAMMASACAVSQQQEVQLGQQYAQQINAQLPIITDPEINRYINVLGDSVAKLTGRGDLEWTFYVVDAADVNAFAVPGGFIYINRGLIERTIELDQLAGVLGHEIGHVVKRHSIDQMQKQQQANIGLTLLCVLQPGVCRAPGAGQAINAGAGALFANFSRKDEAEADAEAIKNVVRAGINPEGIPAMFEILLAERRSRPEGVAAWFATHPTEESRIAETRAQIGKIDPAILRTLTHDSQAFQQFKNRLRSMPPSPAPRAMPR